MLPPAETDLAAGRGRVGDCDGERKLKRTARVTLRGPP